MSRLTESEAWLGFGGSQFIEQRAHLLRNLDAGWQFHDVHRQRAQIADRLGRLVLGAQTLELRPRLSDREVLFLGLLAVREREAVISVLRRHCDLDLADEVRDVLGQLGFIKERCPKAAGGDDACRDEIAEAYS